MILLCLPEIRILSKIVTHAIASQTFPNEKQIINPVQKHNNPININDLRPLLFYLSY